MPASSTDAPAPWNPARVFADHVPPAPFDGFRAPAPVRPGSWAAWRVALRPRTFWIAAMPVLVSSCLAWHETGLVDLGVAALALVASLLLQAITNLQNDVGYATRAVDTARHVGLSRATTNGWLAPRQVHVAIAVATLVTLAVGAPIVAHSGWPAAAMGASSLAAAIGYMGGPRPIAFTPLGELTVFVFFGLVAVIGSYYVQTGTVTIGAVLVAIAVGALAAAVLAVNNHRDAAHDAIAGRRTFAVVFGPAASRRLYGGLLMLAFLLSPVLVVVQRSPWFLLPLLALPVAMFAWRDFHTTPSGPGWNALLFLTVKLELGYGLLLAAGALLARYA
jgi:1,4-dihydroxy-2-naphthoate polyprenyltransferase